MSEEQDPETVFEVFGNEFARRVLVLASHDPVSAEEIADHLGVSLPTVYRRVNALVDHGFLHERPHVDGKGNQYKLFETAVKRIEFEVGNGQYELTVEFEQGLADRFEGFWEELEGSARSSFEVEPASDPREENNPYG